MGTKTARRAWPVATAALLLSATFYDKAHTQSGYNPEGIRVTTGTLTAAQVQVLNATPIEVIAAPGSGKAIIVESTQFMLDWNSAAYDNDGAAEDLAVRYVTNTSIWGRCDNSSCLDVDATADDFGYVSLDNGTLLGMTLSTNDAIEITILNGEIYSAAGDSPIHYKIRYRVVDADIS